MRGTQPTGLSRPWFFGTACWDWLDLLVVPAFLVIVALVFTSVQDGRQQTRENAREDFQLELEVAREAVQATVEANRAQDNILQDFLVDISALMLRPEFHEMPHSTCEEKDAEAGEIGIIVRTRTEVVRNQLGGARLGIVVRFLIDSQLLSVLDCDLSGMDLRGADVSDTDLRSANLSDADLSDADLSDADLRRADLINAALSDANLSDATLLIVTLFGANLSDADLRRANLVNADLSAANLSGANLTNANLERAAFAHYLWKATLDETTTLPDGSNYDPAKGLEQMERFTDDTHPNFWQAPD